LKAPGTSGFHSLSWDVKVQQPGVAKKGKPAEPTGDLKYAGKGKYKVKFLNGADNSEVTVEIK
jgi:hypothetical protein